MVSDAMVKIVFLSVSLCARVFPVRKTRSQQFFKVKQIFLKIKLWPAEPANEKERERSQYEDS